MKIIQSPATMQKTMLELRQQGLRVAFVPTMGNLHQGHLSLLSLAKEKADILVCSIFVNPMQFGPNEDFDSYPRTLGEDRQKLEGVGCHYCFTPTKEAIYPAGEATHTSVEVNRLTDKLCGKRRPGHFKGVTTIVNILFNIVQPNIAVFGKKDYQQYQIIKTMVRELMMPVKIIGGEIVRERNGLAMSSRNNYLTEKEKESAAMLRQVILQTAAKLNQQSDFSACEENAKNLLKSAGFKVDYFNIVSQSTLERANRNDRKVLIAAAAWLGAPRLIDNLEVELPIHAQ